MMQIPMLAKRSGTQKIKKKIKINEKNAVQRRITSFSSFSSLPLRCMARLGLSSAVQPWIYIWNCAYVNSAWAGKQDLWKISFSFLLLLASHFSLVCISHRTLRVASYLRNDTVLFSLSSVVWWENASARFLSHRIHIVERNIVFFYSYARTEHA